MKAQALALIPLLAWAPAMANWSLSGSLGANFAPALGLAGGDNDRAARCDGFVNPHYAEVPGCVSPDRGAGAVDDWMSDFSSAKGLLATAAIGYRLSERWQVEAEYSFAESKRNESALIQDPSGTPFTERFGAELPRAEERIGSVTSHSLFANLHWRTPVSRRVSLNIGFGIGVGFTDLDYGALWARSPDPATVRAAAGLINEDEVRRNLAGTVTSVQGSPSQRLFGYQALAGIDYRLVGALRLGLAARWTRFEKFSKSGGPYDRLRSHASNLRVDGGEPVTWRIATNDIEFIGINLELTYEFTGAK